jgi:RimJ/RimL family protein N-acetyltransferase
MPVVALRAMDDADLDAIFEQSRDPVAVQMAAFTRYDPSDRAAFDAHMARLRASPTVIHRVVTADGVLAGTVGAFEMDGETHVTYWIDRSLWGQGIAGQALRLLLDEVKVRPVHAHAAADNAGSLRVLNRAGFKVIGEETAYAAARRAEIVEKVLRLEA